MSPSPDLPSRTCEDIPYDFARKLLGRTGIVVDLVVPSFLQVRGYNDVSGRRGKGELGRVLMDVRLDAPSYDGEDLEVERCEFETERVGEHVDCRFGGVVDRWWGQDTGVQMSAS